ncbi:MAG: protein kinase domain-containing protein [Chloroflexota bacterium]
MTDIEQLGQYRIEGVLGRGGMAVVYRAYHIPLRRSVALKVLDSFLSQSEEFQQRFEQEARLAAGLEHPNIIHIYDLGTADDRQFIAMRLNDGSTLEDVLRDTGALPVPRVLNIVAAVADALSYAHENGVYHRDVKPSNILLRSDDRPVLSDFGIARAVEGLRLTVTQRVVGTPRYMSPEQALGRPVDHRSDIYSLGVVMYEMLVGTPPFDSPSTPSLLYMHVHEAPPPLGQRLPRLSAGIRELVDKCLAKDPDDRFQDASEIAESCRSLLALVGGESSRRTGSNPPLPSQGQTIAMPRPSSPSPTPSPAQNVPAQTGWPQTPVPGSLESATDLQATRQLSFNPAERPPVAPGTASVPPSAPPVTPTPVPTPAPAAAGGNGMRLPIIAGAGVAALVVIGIIAAVSGRFSGGGVTATPTAVSAASTSVTAGPAAKATAPAVTPGGVAKSAASPVATASGAVAGEDPSARLAQAMAALGRRDYQAALDNANAGLRSAPNDPGLAKAAVNAHLGLAEPLWARSALDEAVRHYLAILEPPLRSAASRNEVREAEVATAYIFAAAAEPLDPVLAISQFAKGYRIDPAFRDIRQRYYDATLRRGTALVAQGDHQGARTMLNTAKSIFPDRPEADRALQTLPAQ